MNTSFIKYVARYEKCKKTGLNLPVYSTKRVKKTKITRYANCIHKHYKLSKCAQLYIMYMSEQMDEKNTIHATKFFREKFIRFIHKTCNKKFEDQTVRNALTELVNSDLLISYGGKIDYTVNPLNYYRGTEKSRAKLIYDLLNQVKKICNPKSNIRRALIPESVSNK